MTHSAQQTAAADLDLMMWPNHSLSRKGWLVIFAVAGLFSLIPSITFVSMGAWPVLGFFGLDFLALYFAFKTVERRAAQYEQVRLDHDGLTVTARRSNGRVDQLTLEPTWVQVELQALPYENNRLWLLSHGRRVELGPFLMPDERADLARLIRRALIDRKNRVAGPH